MIKIKVRLTKEKVIDCYTVMITQDGETSFFGMSYNALAFNQYCGSNLDGYKDGKHLGKVVKWSNLDQSLQIAILNRIELSK